MPGIEPATAQQLRFTNPWLFTGGGSVNDVAAVRLPPRWVSRIQVDPTGFREPDKAYLVMGPRQAGKSSLIWSYLQLYRRPLFVNLEERRMRAWCASPADFLASLEDLGEGIDLLFLEEAQWLPEVGLFIKGVVDQHPGFPVFATGSASFQLRSRTRESLAGRASRHVLLPFSLAEVAPAEGRSPVELRLERQRASERMLEVGGYPAAWLSEEPRRVLSELVESFVFRDASDLFNVTRLDAFEALLRLAAGQVGSLVNLTEWASLCGVSQDTVARYLAMMEQAHLLELVPAFVGGRRREITSARKAYFLDNGLRTLLLSMSGEPSPTERGARAENLVFSELRKGLPWSRRVRYWRTASKAEVDFVVSDGDRLLGVEVKAGRLTRPKLARSSRSFVDAYSPQELWVVNSELEHEGRLGETIIRWVPLASLPEHIDRWRMIAPS